MLATQISSEGLSLDNQARQGAPQTLGDGILGVFRGQGRGAT